MGITNADLELVLWLKRNGFCTHHKSIVEIGAQQMSNLALAHKEGFENLKQLFNRPAPFSVPEQKATHIVHGSLEHQSPDAPPTRAMWDWLGFKYAAIDIDGSPGSIPLDLNFDSVPKKEKGKYDIVTNYGTTEHVANQLNAFKVIHELTAMHGLMIHSLPAQGMFNHGLVNYNPKFFWMLARSNGYRVVYTNFHASNEEYEFPQNIIDQIAPVDANAAERLKSYRALDCGLVVVLQKVFDIEYVPPLDVPTGIHTTDPKLKERYWTVFDPDAFTPARLVKKIIPKPAHDSLRTLRNSIRKKRA